jgi:hypothetical protein
MGNSAVIDGRFRYHLARDTAVVGGSASDRHLVFVMLNPSIADETTDDHTIRKCRGFASLWGYSGFEVVNLYAFRATDPAELRREGFPIGCENDAWIENVCRGADVVCAWGGNAEKSRARHVFELIRGVCEVKWHLGLTCDGQPRHPLMLGYDTPRSVYL